MNRLRATCASAVSFAAAHARSHLLRLRPVQAGVTSRSIAALAAVGAVSACAYYFQNTVSTSCALAQGLGQHHPRVYVWGSSSFGQLGLGNETNQFAPQPLQELDGYGVTQICAGGDHAAALAANGDVLTWGRGELFVLGHGSNVNVRSPKVVQALKGLKVIHLSASDQMMCAVDLDGNVYTWGAGSPFFNSVKRESTVQHLPQRFATDVWQGRTIATTACGHKHALALSTDGRVFGWGQGVPGCASRENIREPVLIAGALADKRIVQIAAGHGFSLFLDDAGKVYSCGTDNHGETGHSGVHRYVAEPKVIEALADIDEIVDIACGKYHASVIGRRGDLYTFGLGSNGQMGNGLKEFKNLPLLNEALKGAGRKIVQTRCGYGHTAALDSKGVPLVWGRGDCGQLGLRDAVVEKKHQAMAAYREKPVEVEFFSARSSFGRGETVKVTDLALGNDFSMCIVGDTTSK